jgi:hypothetical protein
MTETPQPPAAQPTPPAPDPDPGPAPRDSVSTVGTLIMIGAAAFCAIVLADIMTKGRILGPVIAAFAPKAAPPPEAGPDD